ncbi:MAG TPA: TonB-dependent receptor, partial [Sphingobacteriaceae bacterium]
QFGAQRVEVLRGAASLLYGSDALGGVINILDPLPAADGQVKGELLTNYASNNGLSGSSVMLEGNADGFIWRGRGSYKNAFSYNTPEGRIANTGFNELNISGQLGLNKEWGYTHLDFSSFKSELGLPDFERNAAGQFIDEDGNVLSSSQLKDRQLLLPFQDVRHYKLALNSNILIGTGRLRSNFAYQDNQRRELEESPSEPSLFFDLKTYSYDLKYYFQEKWGWEPVIGIAGSFQENVNKAEELLIPDYKSNDFGVFGYGKKTWRNVTTLSIGARFDRRNITGDQMLEGTEEKFNAFTNTFSNISGALGFTQEFNDQWSFKANLGSAFRAPNIAELNSNGIHEGTFRYEIGNTALDPEKSIYGDMAVEFAGEKASATIGVFNNYINHYIYYRQFNNEVIAVEGEEFPVFRYTQDNANLYGAEAGLTLHPLEVLHFENTFSFTRGKNRTTHQALPFIPAAALRNEIRIEPDIAGLNETYFSVELDNVFRQNDIDVFETVTGGYTLVNAAIGTTFMLNKQPIRVNIAASNLFDKAYVSHLSRLKYEGILNQGRNVSVGIYVPFIFN